ncbi:MAG: hypothetical protein K5695_16745 [Oscillospiraceae bacterium]|nr:hypothetical protein [Oscillospiraceae bacterium]
MKKCTILLAAMAVLCCGCSVSTEQTANFGGAETEMTAPPFSAVEMQEEEMTNPPAPTEEMTEAEALSDEAPVAEEMTAPPLVAAQNEEADAPQPEEDRDADFTWFGRGVYEARLDGQATGEYFVFKDRSSGTYITTVGSYSFACEQTKVDVVFQVDSAEEAMIFAMSGPDANGDIVGEMGEVRYSFVLLPVDPDAFYPSEWAANGGQDAE